MGVFDYQSGKVREKSGNSQGILILVLGMNPGIVFLTMQIKIMLPVASLYLSMLNHLICMH